MSSPLMVTIILASYIAGRSGRVVKEQYSSIRNFSHSVFLSLECHMQNKINFFTCGASVFNQAILLTAAHCLDDCAPSSVIMTYTGHEQQKKGYKTQVISFITHENYNRYGLQNDIALLRLENDLQFGDTVKRVVLMRKPPHDDAVLASWSRIDEKGEASEWLISKVQKILSYEDCSFVLGKSNLPAGAFCAREYRGTTCLGRGGSGSALIAHNFIQIGILSFNIPKRSKYIAVYTDVGYFYDWISENSKEIFCYGNKKTKCLTCLLCFVYQIMVTTTPPLVYVLVPFVFLFKNVFL